MFGFTIMGLKADVNTSSETKTPPVCQTPKVKKVVHKRITATEKKSTQAAAPMSLTRQCTLIEKANLLGSLKDQFRLKLRQEVEQNQQKVEE